MNKQNLPHFRLPMFFEGEPEKKPFDLAAALADPETSAVLKDWAEREVVKPVKDKSEELLNKLVKYKIKLKDPKDPNKEIEGYIDPDEAKRAIETVRSGGSRNVEEEVQRALADARARHEAELAARDERIRNGDAAVNQERQARHNLLIAQTLRSALNDSGVKTGKSHLHEMYLKSFLQVEVDNGVERIVVKDENGKVRYGANGLMSIQEYIASYRTKDGVAEDWNPTAKPGAGTSHGAGIGVPGSTITIPDGLPPSERMKMLRRANIKG